MYINHSITFLKSGVHCGEASCPGSSPSPNPHAKHLSLLHHPVQSVQKAALSLLFCCSNTIHHFQLPSFLPIHQNFRVYLILNFCTGTAFLACVFTPHHPVLCVFFSSLFLLDAFFPFFCYDHLHPIFYAWNSRANYKIFSFLISSLLVLFWYLLYVFYWVVWGLSRKSPAVVNVTTVCVKSM